MAIKQELWDQAKAMFEGGKLLRDIERETTINQSTVGKRAKKEGWDRGKNAEAIINEVKSIEEKARLSPIESEFHDKEVARILKSREETNMIARMGQNIIAIKFKAAIETEKNDSPTPISLMEVKQGIDANDKASITLGVNPRHANAPQINNTNAQQNNEPVTIQIIKAEELSI